MGNESVYIFIDEFGTPDLDIREDKKGNEPYFIYAAVVIKSAELNKARQVLNNLYKNYYTQGFIKSKNIGNDHKGYVRTVNTLTDLKSLEHYVYAYVVDKSKLTTEGFLYKRSFIKFFQRILNNKFLELYDEVHIIADQTGIKDFEEDLKQYLNKKLQLGKTLFSNNTFVTVDDIKEEPLVQLADFYAGTIGKYYCGHYDKNRADVIHNQFLRSRISIDWFPQEYVSYIAVSASFDETFDSSLSKIALDSASKYIETHPADHVGCELLRYLRQESIKNPLRHISSKEIKANLKNMGIELHDPIQKISELRDCGVLVISPIGKKGYKFPNNEKELADFFNRLSGNVLPQLRRGYKMNKAIHQLSNGRYNVLGKPEFELLYRLGELVEGYNVKEKS